MATTTTARKSNTQAGMPRDIAGWLGFAASPTFAVMALCSAAGGSGSALCAPASDLVLIGGMTPMYLLMSLFHLPPWLKIASGHFPRLTGSPTETEGD